MSRVIVHHTICVATALVLSAAAQADLKKDTPKEVCAYLEKEDIKTGPYNQLRKDLYFASGVKKLGMAESSNSLEYNVDGEQPDRVAKVWLNLNVEDPAGAKDGHAALVSAGRLLAEKATGRKPPDAIRKALEKGENGKWKLGELTVEANRIKKGDGKRYVMQLLIK
jgi:hypothetical protein